MADNTGNKYRGEYRAQFAGKNLKFRLGFDQMVAVETLAGRSIVEMATRPDNLRVDQLVEIFALGVEGAGGEIDRHWIREQIGDVGIVEVAQTVGALLAVALVGPDDAAGKDKKTGKPGPATD